MGSARPGGSPREGGGSSISRENAGSSSVRGTRTSGSPVILASATRNSANESVMDIPHLLACGGPDVSSSRRSSWNTPTRPGDQQKGAAEEARRGVSAVIKNSASNSPSRDSTRASSSNKCAKEQVSEHDRIENASTSSSSKKRKRMDKRSYLKQFNPPMKANATDVAIATPDRLGKENTSSRHMVDSNIAMLCEDGRLTEKNKRHSSDAVCKVPKTPISGLHKASETRVDQCTAPFSEVQLHKPTDTWLQNRVAESGLAVEARDRPTGPARQRYLSSLQSAPISPIHYEEPKSTLQDGEHTSIEKKDLASIQFKVDSNSNLCTACGTPGILRSCDGKGCKRRYHISCLDSSLEYLSPGIWFCTMCTKKRFQFGLHSIIDGIESVWDVKEGMQNGKQYFVKYKNLAHVHNRWVPEGDIINDIPGGSDILSLFNKRNHSQKISWKKEWTEPHRLLRKRLLMPPKIADDFFCSLGANFSYCNIEWLVKWRDLGYDHATWELETSPCLCTPEVDELKKNYENRREAAKHSSTSTKTKQVKQSPFQKLQRLPDGCPPDFDNDHLFSINQLREFWYKSHGAVLVDDEELVIKTILFTMSVLPDVGQPFLIVTTPASLSLWEAQFNHLAPFINVIVYDGGKDMLKLIQDMEFYDNENCIMLQVLLSHPDAILEDIESIARIGWEAIIVDYSQSSFLKYLKQLKQLSTDFRVLLLSSQIKDNLPEYISLLAFLKSGDEDNSDYIDITDALVMLKDKFTSHIAYERKADYSNFLEHWVPSYISKVQLEIYCSILLSNSYVLQSQMKTDSVEALRSILLLLLKCCDHPYLLQSSLINNHDVHETIDTRVHASGKLLLLDKMLKEIRDKSLRVIIIFQSGGAGGNPMGNILEGVVRHRFGPESYERVEFGVVMSTKQAAINMFNDKTKGRFVFLIENRACLPSIKLTSVDAIIMYGSDWNPLNDLKALRRINVESQFKYLSIFRLYTPFTVEEKSLMLAKQGLLIDCDSQDIMRSLSHSLISWGASFLFTRLHELQQDSYASKSSESFMDKVISEFLAKLPTNVEESTKVHNTSISKANMSGKFYSRSITLIGEKEGRSALDGDPSKFWLSLIPESPQSSHKLLPNMEEPVKIPAEGTDEARRKRRKVGEIVGSSSKVLFDTTHDDTLLPENCTATSPALQLLDDIQEKLGEENLMSTPKNLHIQLKQELTKLIKVLQLPDNVSFLVEQLFRYILKNHLAVLEPKGIMHAFNIALCWRAASLLNYKVDRRESLALAEKCLNYEYNEALAGFCYGKLRILKKRFANKVGETSTKCQEGSSGAVQMIPGGQELISVQQTHRECHVSNDELRNVIVEKRIDLIDVVFSLREKNTHNIQQIETSELDTHEENEVIRLKEVRNLVLVHIRRNTIDEMTRTDKIQLIVQWFDMLTNAFLEHMRLQRNKLAALQSSTWSKERQLKENLQQEARSGRLDDTTLEALLSSTWSKERQLKENLQQEARSGRLDKSFDQLIALPESNFVIEEFVHFKEQSDKYHVVESSLLDCQQPSNNRLIAEITLVRDLVPSEPISAQAVRNEPAEAFVDSGGGRASEAFDFPENSISCSSDGNCLQRAGCASSPIPANDDSISQESSNSECRNTGHVEGDNSAIPSILLGGAASLVMGVHANNYGTVDADQVHLESPVLASSQNPMTLSVSRKVGTHANLLAMSAQQTVGTLQHPPVEAEPTNTSGVPAAWDLPPEMQTPTSTSDTPFRRTCPDDMSQKGHQSDTTTVLLQEGTTSYHLALGDVSMGVKAKNDGTVAADPLHSETRSYTAPHDPAALPLAREVGTQIDQSSIPAKQNTSMPAQQKLATSVQPHEDAEPASVLVVEAAWDLQPGLQPLASISDAPPEDDDTVAADPLHSVTQSYTVLHDPDALSLAREVETQTDRSSMSAQQNTSMPAQQKLATSVHLPEDAESASVLVMEASRDLQPGLQPSASTSDSPLQRMNPDHSSQTRRQPETPPGQSQGGGTCRDFGDAKKGVDANNSNCGADQAPSLPPTCAAPQIPDIFPVSAPEIPAILPVFRDVGTQAYLSSMSPHQSTDLSAQQNVELSWHAPTDSEGTGLLGTQGVQDLQSEMQPSTSFSDAPLERMHPDDMSQTGCQPDRVSQEDAETSHVLGDVSIGVEAKNDGSVAEDPAHSESPTDTAHSPTLPASIEAETQTCQSSMPAKQSTSMPGQQSLPTMRHPPAEAEPPGIVVPEVARNLQPGIQSSISMQDQPAEAERPGMLGAAAAQDLQPEMQPSTPTQNAPFERTCLSGMPVLRSMAANRSAEPSCDPHAGVEPAGTLGIVTAHDLQSEIQPSLAMQYRPAEAEGAVTLGTTAAQDLQPVMQPSIPMQHAPLERTHSDDGSMVPGPEQPTQLPPALPLVFNYPILNNEPLKNELEKLKHSSNLLSKAHEQKKSQLLIEYNQEIEEIKQKYDSLLEKEDSTYLQSETELDDIYRKVFINQSLAENFREKFVLSSAAQGRSKSPIVEQPPQSSQQAPARASAAQTTASPVALSPASRPPVLNSLHLPGLRVQPSLVALPSPSRAVQPQSFLPSNLYRATSSRLTPTPPPWTHGSYGAAGAQSRAPAPHLQQFRMLSPRATNQQQLPVSPGVTPLRQFVPGIFEGFALTSLTAGDILTSMMPSSVHPTGTGATAEVVCLSDDEP